MSGNTFQVRNIRARLLAIGLGIIYYFALLACYYYLISPIFSYDGLTFVMLPVWTWVLSIILSLMPLLWMPLDCNRPSDFASWFLYLSLIFPANIFVFMVSSLPPIESATLPMVLTASFMLFEIVRRNGRLIVFPSIRDSSILFNGFLPVIMFALTLIVFSYANFRFNFSITDIYERRLEARNVLAGQFAGYLEAILASVCVPIAMIYGIQKRKWHFIVLTLFSLAVIFSLKGSKGALLSPLVFVTVYFLASRKINAGIKLLGIFVSLVGLSLVETFAAESRLLASYVIRRMMVVPSQLTTYYWEFFSNNPFVMMKDSVIGGLIPADARYTIARPRIIGYEYFGSIEVNANANIWAAGYADFGYMGIVITSILAAVMLKVIDSLGTIRKMEFASVCSAFIGMVWAQGALYTSLLSNGVLMLIFAIWLYPSNYYMQR